jgi:anti-anti-sigma regulatory factor
MGKATHERCFTASRAVLVANFMSTSSQLSASRWCRDAGPSLAGAARLSFQHGRGTLSPPAEWPRIVPVAGCGHDRREATSFKRRLSNHRSLRGRHSSARQKCRVLFVCRRERVERANVIVDFARLDYIDSTGVGELTGVLIATARAGHRVVFANVPEKMRRLIRTANATSHVWIFDSVEEAAANVIEWGVREITFPRRAREIGGEFGEQQSTGAAASIAPTSAAQPAVVAPRNLRVFLSYALEDKLRVRKLSVDLSAHGVDVWVDEQKLVLGHDWKREISRAIRSVDVFIVCLTPLSVNKRGYFQKEIREALDVADEQPEGAIFIIPARLEPCAVPDRLARWQWVDLWQAEGTTQLVRALSKRAVDVGASPLRNARAIERT